MLQYSTAELEQACDGFAESRILGTGGFGTVFSGSNLRGDVEVAVKRIVLNTQARPGPERPTARDFGSLESRPACRAAMCCQAADRATPPPLAGGPTRLTPACGPAAREEEGQDKVIQPGARCGGGGPKARLLGHHPGDGESPEPLPGLPGSGRPGNAAMDHY